MSENEIKDYYADLLILQYRTQEKAREHIKALVKYAYSNGLLKQVLEGFNIDTAVGKQLDILGKYIGLNRNVKTILEDSGSTILEDEDYRTLLKFKLLSNSLYSSTSDIKSALYQFFPTTIRVYDTRKMQYQYLLNSSLENLVGVILAEDLLPLPMGVGCNLIVIDDDILEFYGFHTYNGSGTNPNGFSNYTDGFKHKFLSYANKFN